MAGVRMNRPIRIFLPILLAALLAACGNSDEPGPQPEGATAAGAPRRGGTVVAGATTDPLSVNDLIVPTTLPTNEVLFRVLQHLAEEQPDFMERPATFTPQLAESWEWSDDHKTLTFHLRKGLVWSDGVPLTAEDVRWTWQAQIHPAIAWDSAYMKESIRDVEVVDPHTVRFHFTRTYAKQLLDANEGLILPKHLWSQIPFEKWRESADWFKQNMVASGPFKIASWAPQQELVMVRNERYWEKDRPYLDRVVLRVVPDPSSMISQFLNGDLDFVAQVSVTDAARIAERPELSVVSYWSNLYVVVAWNSRRPLFADPEVRRALTLATDRQAIVDTLLPGGNGLVGVTPILQEVWAHDKALKPWPYDPAEARRILAAKGWRDTDGDGILDRDGKKFSFELTSNAGNQMRNDVAVMIQQQLRKAGIEVVPRILEFNALVTDTRSGNFDASVVGFSLDTSLDLSGNFHSDAIANGDNFFHYSNPELDRLIELAAVQTDLRTAEPYIHQIERMIHRDQPLTFLWESKRLSAFNRRVHDARPNLQAGFFNLKDWWVEPRR
jgi:peptide/nickel transport system substrate-binding protein